MSSAQITLKHVFSLEDKVFSGKILSQIESSEGMSGVRERVMPQMGKSLWTKLLHGVTKKVDDLLDIRIADIMVSAWNRYGALRKYTDEKNYAPEKTMLVHLAEHTIKSAHKPYIEILVNEKKVGKVNFEITLALTLKSIVLKIKGGKIMEIETGSCIGKGTIKCENVPIFERKSKEIRLPGSIPLGNGVEIT